MNGVAVVTASRAAGVGQARKKGFTFTTPLMSSARSLVYEPTCSISPSLPATLGGVATTCNQQKPSAQALRLETLERGNRNKMHQMDQSVLIVCDDARLLDWTLGQTKA